MSYNLKRMQTSCNLTNPTYDSQTTMHEGKKWNLIPGKFCFWREIFAPLTENVSFRWIFCSFSYKNFWTFLKYFDNICDHIPGIFCLIFVPALQTTMSHNLIYFIIFSSVLQSFHPHRHHHPHPHHQAAWVVLHPHPHHLQVPHPLPHPQGFVPHRRHQDLLWMRHLVDVSIILG